MESKIPEAQAVLIREFVFAGRKIEAIRTLREATPGLGLAEAKTVIEQLEEELRKTAPEKFTAAKAGQGCSVKVSVFVFGLLLVVGCAWLVREAHGAVRDHLRKNDEWFRSEEGKKAAGNVLSWQSERGDWPKAVDTAGKPYDGDRAKLKGTFDNRATVDEIRFLGRAYLASSEERCREGAIKGIEHVLAAQYASGGWPQSWPAGAGYQRHITFNDDTMVRLMELVREVGSQERWKFVGEERRRRAGEAFERGVACILKCQIRDSKSGKPLGWCAQHDEKDYAPRPARTFELVSISGMETVGIVRLLMSIEKPSAEVVAAVEGAVEWLKGARIKGIRVVEVEDEKGPKGKDKRVVEDAAAKGLWARFYEIETGRAIFVDRDGVAKYSMAEIGYERRNGYAWYGDWGEKLIEKDYPEWKKRMEERG